MKKIFLSCLLFSASIQAQTKYVTTPTIAYNDAKGSKAVGIFLRGAQLQSYEFLKDQYVYKINSNVTGTVYITDTYNIKEHLSSADEYQPSPKVIEDSDAFYGSPHVFTTVAGLKVREQPNSQAAVIGTLMNGTVVPIYYYPYQAEAWIPVEVNQKLGFIPLKYTGKRPILNDLKTQLKKAIPLDEQKLLVERILELGWNSDVDSTIEALEIYSEYASRNHLSNLAELTSLQAKVLKKSKAGNSAALISQYSEKKQFGFTLNKELEPENGFTKDFIESQLGKIKDQYTHLDDCALGDYESNVFFNTVECIGHDLNKTYQIRSMDVVNNNGFRIKNMYLNASTNKIDFLKAAMGFISSIDPIKDSYFMHNEYMSYEFIFKNDQLVKIVSHYYC